MDPYGFGFALGEREHPDGDSRPRKVGHQGSGALLARVDHGGATVILYPAGMCQHHGLAQRQSGIALGVVVWFIAGMALLVSGIVSEAKVDTRMAQLHYFRAQAAAAGDGAINLALAEQKGLRSSGQKGADRLQNYQVGPRVVEIRMIPAGLFVNISTEGVQGLRALFAMGAEVANEQGMFWDTAPMALARAVVAFRNGNGRKRGMPFHSPEDLLRVPGVSRGVYDAIRDYITVEGLAGGYEGKAGGMGRKLTQLQGVMAGEGALVEGAAQHAAESLRVDAIVTIGDQEWLRRRWVSLDEGGYSQLPWRFVRTEAARPLSDRAQ